MPSFQRAAGEADCVLRAVLQVELEKLQYEKDTKWYEENQKKSEDQEELDALRAMLMLQMEAADARRTWWKAMRAPISTYKRRRAEARRAREIYRKSLLLSNKDKKVGVGTVSSTA